MGRVSDSREARTPVPPGKYFGVVVGFYDLGTQPSDDPKFKARRQCVITFELHKRKGMCTTDDGKPLLVSKYYGMTFGKSKEGVKSKFRLDVEAILDHVFTDAEAKEGIDTDDLCDKAVCINLTHDVNKKGGVKEVLVLTPLDEDDPRPRAFTDSVCYDLKPGAPFPAEVPEWIQKMAQRSYEWAAATGQRPPADRPPAASTNDDDDDIPY